MVKRRPLPGHPLSLHPRQPQMGDGSMMPQCGLPALPFSLGFCVVCVVFMSGRTQETCCGSNSSQAGFRLHLCLSWVCSLDHRIFVYFDLEVDKSKAHTHTHTLTYPNTLDISTYPGGLSIRHLSLWFDQLLEKEHNLPLQTWVYP